MSREVLQQALDALENHSGNYKLTDAECDTQEAVVTAIKEALAKQDAETNLQAVADFGQLQALSEPSECWDCFCLQENAQDNDVICDPCRWAKEPASQPEQEPVARLAWVQDFGSMLHLLDAGRKLQEGNHYLYTSPPQREWVGLTGEEHQWIKDSEWTTDELVNWIEAKLKEKNA